MEQSLKKGQFKKLLEAAIETVIWDREKRTGTKRPGGFQIEFCGLGHTGEMMDVDAAVDLLYLGEDLFYRIIDVGTKGATSEYINIFVRVSGHPPASFDKTWNDPPGSGPFKPIVYGEIGNWPPVE